MALDCDGVDDLVDHGDIAAIDNATALSGMIWVFLDTLGVEEPFFGKVDLDGNTLNLYFGIDTPTTTTLMWAATYSSVNGARVANALATGVWAHFAFVYDGNGVGNAERLFLYKNGVGLTETFVGTVPASLAGSAQPFRVAQGEIADTNTHYLDGRVAHLKMWSAVLTAAEVFQEMNSYHPVRTAGLILWSPYDDGTSARDYSGNGNHGTVTGALQIQGPPVSYGGQN